ncbi:MAG: hypothetical protein ACREAM_25395 [Blastocatellia bacterium]
MAWKKVEKYWLGYNIPEQQFLFSYKLEGKATVNQLFPTPEEFLALADMFRNEGPISFNTTSKYFTTAPEEVGEEESKP